ncbi:unnamed protein product [Mytilus edulis]|uniref:COR domain-containing protein n=1 Tax=Mytilus edulis TaxID=6550 RepID=A0A8S3PM95_MYTED|nr:unnamed protein product [Mytilus edulis]
MSQTSAYRMRLDHRVRGTDDWSTETFLSGDVMTDEDFLSGDVMKDEDGRRMFTLQNLKPETYYEFKMRSIYKDDVKSHYSESKAKQTLKLAPREFNIIECTDCSMTIGWFIDDSHEGLSYELDHRVRGTDDWSTETFLSGDVMTDEDFFSGDVMKDEDGRMYTLQNLKPETYYECKMRSIDKDDVKSHYSESKAKQTLKLGLQLSEKDKISYNKLMQTSKKENRYFVRTMIVGKETVGKTCLLRRLLKEDISDVTSTDGVDIVVRRCKINIEDGQWIIGKEIDDDKVSRIKRALDPNAKKRVTQNMQVDEKNLKRSEDDEMSTHQKYTSDTKDSQDKSDYKNESAILAMSEDLTTDSKVNLDQNGDTNESSSLVMPADSTSDAKFNQDNNEEKKESSSLVMPDDLVSNVFSKTADNTLSNLYALCELWDFAGQKEFYATHQAFLTSSAVYLVVADMKDDISKQGLSQCFADFQHIGEYVDFWFDSIHCHRTTKERPRYGHFDPPIILVFTGKDKYENEADFMKREKELNGQIDQVFGFQSKYHHLHYKFYLSNIKDTDEEFEKLRYAISESARKMDNWGNAFPVKWILLEHLIEINKNAGGNFINFTDMLNLAKHPDINMLENKDLMLFLRFQHNVGNIIFFENIPDLIILRPQWLADAFRCLVSDRVDNRRLHHLEDWTLFIRQGKISEPLITELFKSKDGIQFSGQKNNLHQVMENLDILVKIEKKYYIMPSMVPSSTFDDVCKKVGIQTGNCKRTSWLCFKFEFLPPSFFNHISAWFIRKYNHNFTDMDSNSAAFDVYRGICVFDIDGSGCEKLLVSMSNDIIALQVVLFSEQQEKFGSICSEIYKEVKTLIEAIKKRYTVKLSFKLHFKCSDGDYYNNTFVYEKLQSKQECFCPQHKKSHRSDLIYLPWMKNEVGKIPDDRAKVSRSQDELISKHEPNKEAFDENQAYVKNNLSVSVTLFQQLNITKSSNEIMYISSCIKTGNTLVFTDYDNKRLIICNSDGTDIHYIPLSHIPSYITEIDSNTVAVSCKFESIILIINISTRSITSTINTRGNCCGISYNDNNLYVVIDWSIIHVMDLTGKVIRTIPLPTDGIYDITVDRDRLICIDKTSSIYCCSLDGKLMWKFKMDEFQDLNCVTTDNEGNVYVTNEETHTVIVVSDDGKHHRELLTKSDGLDRPYGIYFDKKENILLVCNERDGNAFLFDVIKKLT